MLRDITQRIGPVQALAPAILVASATGPAIDTLGFESLGFVLTTGALVGAAAFSAKIQESDDTVDGDFTDVGASSLVGAFPTTLVASATTKVGYLGGKRYARLVLTYASGTSLAAGAVAILGDPKKSPVP